MNQYEEYIDTHTEEIAQLVNQDFEAKKDQIKSGVLRTIKEDIDAVPIMHYIWVCGGRPYNASGRLKEDGEMDLNLTVAEFLEEYTGCWHPTLGRWGTYGDSLAEDMIPLADKILRKRAVKCLKSVFPDITNEDAEDAIDRQFDEVYMSSYASDFFFGEAVVEFLGISDVRLKDIE